MRRVRLGLGMLGAWLAACGDQVGFVALTGLEGSLVVVARTSADLALREARLVDPTAPHYFEVEETDEVLHAFALDAALVQRPGGRPLSEVDRAALTVAIGAAGDGGACVPCRVPADAPPFVLEPGSRCVLAPFFAHRLGSLEPGAPAFDEAQIAALRSSLRVEWPGDCSCPPPKAGPVRGRFEACEVQPGPVPHRWHALAISNDGAIAALHPSMILTATVGAPPVFHPLPDALIRPSALVGVGARGRRFVAVGQGLSEQPDVPELALSRLEGDERFVANPITERGAQVTSALYDPSRRSVFFFGPTNDGADKRAWRCDEQLASCEVARLARCNDAPFIRRPLGNALRLASGDLVALSHEGHLLQLPAGESDWRCRAGDPALFRIEPTVAGGWTGLRVDSFARLLQVGDRLFACGQAGLGLQETRSRFAMVASGVLQAGGDRWHQGEVAVTLVERGGLQCRGLWHDPARGEVHAYFFGPDAIVDLTFDAAGRPIQPQGGPRFAGLSELVALVETSPDGGRRLILTAGGSLFAQRGEGTLSPVGPAAPGRASFALAGASGVLLLGGGAPPRVWDGGCGASSLAEAAPLDALVTAAAALPDGRVALAADGEASIYDATTGVVERATIALSAVRDLVALDEDELVALTADGEAHLVTLSPPRVDRLTFEAEPGEVSPGAQRFAHLSGGAGVAWLSGGARLARVRHGPSGVRAELWWGSRIAASLSAGEEPLEVDAFAGTNTLCSGATVVFVRAVVRRVGTPDSYLARSVLLEPEAAAHGYRARVLPGFSDQTRFGATSFVELALRVSASASPILGFESGMVLRPDSEPWFAPSPALTGLTERDGRVVVSDRAGVQVFLRSP